MTRFVCFGEMLLRFTPPGRERLFQSSSLETNFVGAEINAGVTLSRLGHDVSVVTTIPNNTVGYACRDSLRQHGLDVSKVFYTQGRMATLYLAPGAMSRPSAIIYDRKNSAFADNPAENYDWADLLIDSDWLHISGISLAISDHVSAASLAAVQMAQVLGVRVSFDCNYRASLWTGREEESRKTISEMLKYADLVFGNARDAHFLFGGCNSTHNPEADFENASELFFKNCPKLKCLSSTHRTVISSDHNRIQGFISDGTNIETTPVHELQSIVDRIGTGDAFAGGVLHGVASGYALSDSIAWGIESSKLKHGTPGDFNLTSFEELKALVKGGNLDVSR